MATIFISYSRIDNEQVDSLAEDLGQGGHQVLLDQHDLIAGQQWWDELCVKFATATSISPS